MAPITFVPPFDTDTGMPVARLNTYSMSPTLTLSSPPLSATDGAQPAEWHLHEPQRVGRGVGADGGRVEPLAVFAQRPGHPDRAQWRDVVVVAHSYEGGVGPIGNVHAAAGCPHGGIYGLQLKVVARCVAVGVNNPVLPV